MKTLLIASALLFTGLAWAEQPKVSCEIMRHHDGPIDSDQPLVFKSLEITKEMKSISVNGIEIAGRLEQVCAQNSMGGGAAPCFDSYTLKVSLASGDASSTMSTAITSQDKNRRFSTSLVIGGEIAFVNCDVK